MCFLIFLSDSVAIAAWSGIQRVDPQMIHFELFYHLVRRSQSTPKHYLFILGRWKKYILSIHPKKIRIPASFHSKAFVYFFTNLRPAGRYLADVLKQRYFFAISGASNFKQLFMTLSGLGSLTMWELPRWVSYFVSSVLSNYFSCFLQDFWSSPSFLPSKPSFLHDHFTTQHSDYIQFFSSFHNR